MNSTEALKQSYRLLSSFSDNQQWEFNNNLVHLKFLIKYLKKTDKILDYGCGIGILSLALKLLGYNVKGEDKFIFSAGNNFSVVDLGRLKQIWENNNLLIGNESSNLGEFDVIISVAVIEHQSTPRLFLEKLSSRLKTNGLIYLATPNIANFLNRFRFFLGRAPLGNLKDFYHQAESFVGHWREYTLKEVKQMCEWAGLEVVKARTVQNQRPDWAIGKWRIWHRNLFRILAYLIPEGGDANIIICRK